MQSSRTHGGLKAKLIEEAEMTKVRKIKNIPSDGLKDQVS